MSSLDEKLKKIKRMILDVDGVLTDGRIIKSGSGEESKAFHINDGTGIYLLRMAGVEVSLITGRYSAATEVRAKELCVEDLYQGVALKEPVYDAILSKFGLLAEETLYIGDDIIDIPVLKKAGIAVVVGNAVCDMKPYADYVTKAVGGDGAVREVTDMIIKAKGMWDDVIAEYLKPQN